MNNQWLIVLVCNIGVPKARLLLRLFFYFFLKFFKIHFCYIENFFFFLYKTSRRPGWGVVVREAWSEGRGMKGTPKLRVLEWRSVYPPPLPHQPRWSWLLGCGQPKDMKEMKIK